MSGPTMPISMDLHATKYREAGEDFETAMTRISGALADQETDRREFLNILMDMRFLPAGRVQSAMGAAKTVTPYNCFVSGTIDDSFIDGSGSIMARATEAAATMRLGGGIGYDFSTLRPHGALIKKLGSQSSGPLSFMEIFDAVCKCVASSGHRRGAQMGILRVDHPDVEAFIAAKQNSTSLTGFNLSIGITHKFMERLASGEPFPLEFNGVISKYVDPRELWEKIMLATWDWAEPGVVFIDRINEMNNLWYCETIAATNPCGEQPLPPYGACLLGSFNLTKYVTSGNVPAERSFDITQLEKDCYWVVRAMDNVVDRATYPLEPQAVEARTKRRMGIGVTGLANAIEALGYPYGSARFLGIQKRIMQTITEGCYNASIQLAREKGAFELFDPVRYVGGKFIKTLNLSTQKDIRRYGIRNSHLTSIAPTGTISLCADNVSSGIEPVFNYGYDRTIQTFEGPTIERVSDYGFREFGVEGKQANDVSIDEHLAVLLEAQRNVDSAVSKTCNVPGTVSFEKFKQIYVNAYNGGAKGCTTFRMNGKRMGILAAAPVEETAADLEGSTCEFDPVTGRRSCE